MQFLRTNTAVIVAVGPFYDAADGVTPETSLTITNERITLTADTDDGSAPTLILDNVTGATSGTANDLNYITGQDNGMMQIELAAANVNRLGRMTLTITDASNHVPVVHDFMVLPANVYDAFVLGTDALQVHANEITAGLITAAAIADGAIDAATFAAGAIDATAIAANAIGASELATDAVTEIATAVRLGMFIASGTIGDTGNDTTHLHLTGLAHVDDALNDMLIVIQDVSTGLYHSAWIEDWANAGDLATLSLTLTFTPQDSTDLYWVLPVRQDVTGGSGLDAAGVRAAVGLASANLDTQLGGIQSDTDNMQTRLPAALVSGRIDANVGAISDDSGAADTLEAELDGTAGAVPTRAIIDQGTAQSATSTTVVLRSAAAFADSTLVGAIITVFGSTQGYWQQRVINSNTLADDTVNVDAWTVTPTGTITYKIYAAPPASAGLPVPVNVLQWGSSNIATPSVGGVPEVDVTHLLGTVVATPTNAGVIEVDLTHIGGSAVSTSTAQLGVNAVQAGGTAWGSGAITAGAIATGAIDADALAADASTEINSAVLAVLGALNNAAADGAVTTTDTIVAYLKQIINTLEGGPGITTWPAAATAGDAVSIAEAIRSISERLPAALNNGVIPADVQRVNNVEIVGDGDGTPFDVA